MFKSILVVCTGNICRSPIAERILKNGLPGKNILSAGVGAMVDHPADPSAVIISEINNLSLEGHSAKQLTDAMSKEFDLILVMDKQHIEKISRIAPEARGKTMLLGHWIGNKEIPDPYRQSKEAFDFVYKLIDQACKTWIEKLR